MRLVIDIPDETYQALMADTKIRDLNKIIFKAIAHGKPPNRWIPVSERLPEKTGLYLVSGKWRNYPSKIWIAKFSDIFGLRGWENDAKNPIIDFWMPLPKSPYEK